MMMYGAELYPTLAADTGVDPGWHQVGTLHLASSPYRMEALARQAGWAKSFGLPVEIVSAEEALERFPLIDGSRVLGAQFVPTDGHIDPTGLTLSFAAGAKAAGARVRTGVRVEEVTVRDGRVAGVVTDHGTIEADVVVNAGGIWAHELGRLAGVEIPVVPMEHQYLITRPIEGVAAAFPTLRDPDNLVYVREEVGGLVVGGYERNPDPWHVHDPIPPDFNHRLLPEKWGAVRGDRRRRVPPDPGATDDGDQPVHQRPRGVHARRRLHPRRDGGGGVLRRRRVLRARRHGRRRDRPLDRGVDRGGRALDGPLEDGRPAVRSAVREPRVLLAKAYEIYAKHYDVRYPGEELLAGRPLRTSPTYGRLQALDAEFGEKAGWERANWFRSNEDPAHEDRRPRGWAGEQWSTAIVAEHLATGNERRWSTKRASRRSKSRGPTPWDCCSGCARTTWT